MPVVSSCHASPGGGAVGEVAGVAVVGSFGESEEGNVPRLNAPKWRSWATKCPVIVAPCANCLQSPELSMWMSTAGAVLSSWMRYIEVEPSTLSVESAISSHTYHWSSPEEYQ